MLRLPKATEINKQIAKSAIYAKFQLNSAERARIDRDISRIYIVNEVSAAKVNLQDGGALKTFFVMEVLLKRKDYDEKNISMLSKLIPQNMVMALEYKEEIKLTTYRTKLLQTDWLPKGSVSLELKGLDLDSVWENIIVYIGGLTVAPGRTIDEQIRLDEQRAALQKAIDKLEKAARAEQQPKQKFALVQRMRQLKEELMHVG